MGRTTTHLPTARFWWPLLLVGGCELVTDFSPPSRSDGDLPDGEPPADVPAPHCSEIPDPCPPGMVYVPCGPFRMGAPAGSGEDDERPLHTVQLSAFCIDHVEVTNAAFAECVRAYACDPPFAPGSATRPAYYSDALYVDFPVLHIDVGLAAGYCAWKGKRLPTEAEWEKAARGGCERQAPEACGTEDELWYPWGNVGPSCSMANFSGCGGDTTAVGTHVAGGSPYGVEDLAGNAAEWTVDGYGPTSYAECATGCTDPRSAGDGTLGVVRGGAWNDPSDGLRISNRVALPPEFASEGLGFRCAASIP